MNCVPTSCEVSSISCTASSVIPQALSVSRKTLTIAILEFIASLPPLKITALPDLKQSAKASGVTLGLASYIIPTTPSGTRFLPIKSPLGRFFISSTSPTGSLSAATCSRPSAMPLILSSVSISLSISPSFIPFSRPAKTSLAFASSMLFLSFISASAQAMRALFLVSTFILASSTEACFALIPSSDKFISSPVYLPRYS